MTRTEHPGGFTKHRLLRIAGITIRLHRWTPGPHPAENPHQHRWWLISLPLGTFLDTRWQETSHGQPHTVYEATGHADDPTPEHYENNLTHPQNSHLSLRRQHVRHPLLPYLCRSGDIHSYQPIGPGPHASIVVTGPARSPIGRVWKDPA